MAYFQKFNIIIIGIISKLGVDKAIAYTLLSKVFNILASVLTLYFISTKLSREEQGYYYAFSSILAIQVFFELGFGNVLSQFASHEMAKLEWRNNILHGNSDATKRMHSLFKLAFKWYSICSLLMLIITIPAGYIFFRSSSASSPVNWQVPWITLVTVASGNLFLAPVLSLFEGSGFISQIAKLRFFQSILSNGLAWVVLIFDEKLFVSTAIAGVTFLSSLSWILVNKRNFFLSILREKSTSPCVSWKNEIWPLQWRIALSWLSGYFIFQIFTPITFKYHGPISAGQVGMSFTITNTLSALAMSWISTKTPLFCKLIADNNHGSLNNNFKKSTKQALFIYIFLALFSISLTILIYKEDAKIAYRILPPTEFTLLILAGIANFIIFSQATYVRAHKCEPYLFHAIITALLVGPACYYFGRYHSVVNMLEWYTSVIWIIGLPYSTYIFNKFYKHKRK